MRYLLQIYHDQSTDPAPGSAESDAIMGAYMAYTGELAASGKMRGGEALFPATSATTVRVRNGETLMTDGPFAETKEQLGGFYIVESDDLDGAIAWAAKIPHAANGSIEVRPIMEFDQP